MRFGVAHEILLYVFLMLRSVCVILHPLTQYFSTVRLSASDPSSSFIVWCFLLVCLFAFSFLYAVSSSTSQRGIENYWEQNRRPSLGRETDRQRNAEIDYHRERETDRQTGEYSNHCMAVFAPLLLWSKFHETIKNGEGWGKLRLLPLPLSCYASDRSPATPPTALLLLAVK